MSKTKSKPTSVLLQPWLQVVLLAVITPMLPDYITPLLALAAAAIAFIDAKKRHRTMRIGPVGKVMIAFIFYMTLRLIGCADLMLGSLTVLMWVTMFLFYIALTSVVTTAYRLETMLFCVSVVAGALGLLACVQYLANMLSPGVMPLQFWDWADSAVFSLLPFDVTIFGGSLRAGATFQNPNFFAQYAVMVMPFIVYYAFIGERSRSKIFARFCLLFLAFGMAFSFSRGCYFGVLMIAVVMCIANLRRIRLIAATAFSAFLIVPQSVFKRFISLDVTSDLAITERLDIWGIAMEKIILHPLFGYGPGVGFIWQTLNAEGIAAPHAHNILLEFLLEGGLIAVVFLCVLMWRLLRTGFDLIVHSEHTRLLGAAAVAFAAAFCLYGMVDYPLFTPRLIGVFCMVLAFADTASAVYLRQETSPLTKALPFYQAVSDWRQRHPLMPMGELPR